MATTIPEGTYIGQYGYTILKKNITSEQLENIKDELTVRPETPGAPKSVSNKNVFYAYRYTDKKLFVPYYYGVTKFGIPAVSKLPEGDPIDIEFAGELRPKQVPVVEAFMKHIDTGPKSGGLLELPCAFGKTCLALYIISLLKTKTLIIVHKTFLLNQWVSRITEFLPGVKIGKIQGGVIDVEGADIVIGMLQSLSMKEYPKHLFDCFGLTVIDEVHHISSETFSKSLFNIVTKYTLGLSATMNRKDGTTNVFKMFLGGVRFKGTRAKREVSVKSIKYISDDDDFNALELDKRGDVSYSRMVTKLCEYTPRSEFILEVIKDMLEKEPDQQIMIIGTNKSIIKYMHDAIKRRNIATVGNYIGGMSESKLTESENKQVITATYAMAAEGLDIPSLTKLVMVTPRVDIEQTVGRVLRDQHSLPEVVDIVDKHSVFMRQSKKRETFFKSEGYTIDTITSTKYFETPQKWTRKSCYNNNKSSGYNGHQPLEDDDPLTGKCFFTDKTSINK
jgi:superfamily II DNA or RNA helicase